MGSIATLYTHLFIVLVLVSVTRLDTASEPCPTPCRCTVEILNCSRTTNPPGLHRVPFPKAAGHPHVFFFLDFTDNAISTIGKEVWRAYPWAEYLVLKGNSLTRLQNTSLDGLLSLTHLDLSCNKIRTIEKNAFEPVPFLQFINLSGNNIGQITQGAFEAWHGMQFLLKLVLNHNQLTAIEDDHFYKLPSLKFLDLGATEIAPKTLVGLLKTTLQLKTLILPKNMTCCLCRIQNDIEVLCEFVKLDCSKPCDTNVTLCAEKDEGFHKMQEEVMKILETRKLNSSTILNILPERPLQENVSLAMPVNQSLSHFGIHFNKLTPQLFTTVKQLGKLKADDFLDVKWTDKSELKKLFMLAKLLQTALKEKIVEYEKENEGTQAPNSTSTEAPKETVAPALRKKRDVRKARKENWSRSRRKSLLGVGRRNRQQFSKVPMQYVDMPDTLDLPAGAQHWRRLSNDQEPLRPHQAGAHQSSWKRSISESSTETPALTASILVDDNDDNDLTGKVVIILKHGNRSRKHKKKITAPPVKKQEEVAASQYSQPERQPAPFYPNEPVRGNMENGGGQVAGNVGEYVGGNVGQYVGGNGGQYAGGNGGQYVGGNGGQYVGGSGGEYVGGGEGKSQMLLNKEQLLNQLMHRGPKPKIPEDSENLNELSPDITLSHETHWEHHESKTSTSPQQDLMKPQDDYLRQGDLFEAELNKRLAPLIPNVPVRNLISHVIRILKMDCTEPTIQMACAKLISRTGLLMKLFSERENIKETSSLWKSYFWPVKNATTPQSRKMGKPSDEIARQGIPEYGYGNKLLLAISVTAVIMVIIAVICLIEICSQRSAARREGGEKRGFLGRRSKLEKQGSTTSSFDKPLWLKDMDHPLDDTRRKSMADKLHDEESSEEDELFNWANARPPSVPEAPPPVEKASLPKLAPPPEAPPPPPSEEAPLVKKASSKKLAPEAPPTSEEAPTEGSAPKAKSDEESEAGTAEESGSKKPSEGEEEEEEEG
ncbi:leucine-rich repeat-containing protein 37A-like [Sceloporus undulatus]|uniref:leucine-rich repeat-containing protein 37A-like n=1 Tax=Sceloporus undulatus TaxID=8520 RepID=UPI001C4CA566|nr:leucine-rich repeat-containing protein 37A-like [Sceloporus undulatus]